MDCRLCSSRLAKKEVCPGCRNMVPGGTRCVIIDCRMLPGSGFCHDCAKFPCRRMKQLDERYTTRYGMSMIRNLGTIKKRGLPAFIELQNGEWSCPECGSLLCIHRPACLNCNAGNMRFSKRDKERT